MPSPEQAYQDMEVDRGQREREIRLIERLLNEAGDDDERAILSRTLVLVTYAHLEGFTKSALSSYIGVVNALKLPCQEAALPLVAATLKSLFQALGDRQSKHEMFKDLSADHDLHLQHRQLVFLGGFHTVMSKVVDISDAAIDTGANLNGRMLRRALFQLGLNQALVDPVSDTLNRLVQERNAIAHGDILRRPKAEAATSYVAMAFQVMQFIEQEVNSAISQRAYERRAVNGT